MIFTNALTILYLILGYLHTCYIHYKKKLKNNINTITTLYEYLEV